MGYNPDYIKEIFIYKGICKTKNLYADYFYPIKIINNENAEIENIIVSPRGNIIDECRIFFEGDYSNTNIKIINSTILEGGNYFKLDKPIIVYSEFNNTILRLCGNFSNTHNIIVNTPVTIEGDSQLNPFGADVELNLENNSDYIKLSGDLSSCNFSVVNSCNIKCNGKINNLSINDTAFNINISVSSNAYINNLYTKKTVFLDGDETAINNVIANSHTFNNAKIIVRGVYKEYSFISGTTLAKTNINIPGKYILHVNVLEGNKIKTLNQNIPITIV